MYRSGGIWRTPCDGKAIGNRTTSRTRATAAEAAASAFGGRTIGIGTIVIALVGGAIFGINPLTILGILSGGSPQQEAQQGPAKAPPADDRMAKFVSTVLADTEDVWKQLFAQGGATYKEPRLVLFRGAVPTACGTGQSAMGPVLLPGRPEGLHRPELLRDPEDPAGRARRLRPGLRDRPRGGPPRAEPAGHHRPDGAPARPGQPGPVQRHERASWNCRPTASPASGPTTPRTPARSWSRATSRRP